MLKRTVDLVATLEGLGLAATLVLGLGCLGYVAVTWVMHLFVSGAVATSGIVAVAAFALAAAALARVPLALLVVFCGAVVVGTAFLSGTSGLVLP